MLGCTPNFCYYRDLLMNKIVIDIFMDNILKKDIVLNINSFVSYSYCQLSFRALTKIK